MNITNECYKNKVKHRKLKINVKNDDSSLFAEMDPSPPPASVSSPSHLHHDDGRVRMSPNNENGQDLTSRSDVSKT